ncbi:MAG TPA: hypothetical protein VMH32_13975 [Burkholderiales bacterium]|nr:hypothetical protein [Burkholderiales bacterium]
MGAQQDAQPAVQELVVQVADIKHLFTAPDTDPLAQHEGEVMGEPALLRVVRRLMAAGNLGTGGKLVVLLPTAKTEPGLAERTHAALVRFCTLRLDDNDAELRILRREAARLLLRGLLILAICMGLSSLFRGDTITFLPPLIRNTLGEGFNVIGWVMLWRPVETYFFNPLPIRASSAALRFLRSLQVEIRAQPAPVDAARASEIGSS